MKTARAIVIALCTMLLLGTFATAQYGRRYDRDRYPSRAPYESALSDLHQAMDIMNTIDRGMPNHKEIRDNINYAINQLNGAANAVGQSGSNLPPSAPVRRGDRLDMVSDLLERADRKLASYRERNPDANTLAQTARDKIQDALQLVERTRSGRGRW